MERRVKERLVGAAVLMAAAIILIPEMLSGRREQRVANPPPSDPSLKTYTIDLNRSPGTASPGASAPSLDERAPPPESESESGVDAGAGGEADVPEPAHQAVPERGDPVITARDAVPERPAPEPAPPARAAQPAPTAETPTSRAIVSAPPVPTSRGWAVQLGSFASRSTADSMVRDLSQQGQSAFVMPVKSANATLYRVRIGPFGERAAADAALREVKGRVANAAVVAHP